MAYFNFVVPDDVTPMRLDAFIAAQLPQYSRSFITDKCRLTVGGAEARASAKVRAGDAIRVAVPPMRELTIEPEDIPLVVVYEDADILVIDKAAGMVVHPTDHGGHVTGTLVNAVLHHLKKSPLTPLLQRGEAIPTRRENGGISVGGEHFRPGIVHRLDRDTSGLIIVAKTDAAKASLTAQFADRTVEKEYLALVAGHLPTPTGRIDAPIGRGLTDRTRREVTMGSDAREAVTEFFVAEEFAAATLVRVHILTGRTHQIRVHFTSIGHPVVGDTTYGFVSTNDRIACPRQFLHAHRLSMTHPTSGERMIFTSSLPADLERVIDGLRRGE